MAVAEKIVSLGAIGRVLAPVQISGLVSRLENHPRLVVVRPMYLFYLK